MLTSGVKPDLKFYTKSKFGELYLFSEALFWPQALFERESIFSKYAINQQYFQQMITIDDTDNSQGICFSCILHLRDAFKFKKQVLKCQREIQERLQNGIGLEDKKLLKVKQETIIGDQIVNVGDIKQQSDDENFFRIDLKEEFGDQGDGEDDKNLALLAIEQLNKRKEITIKNLSIVITEEHDLNEESVGDQGNVKVKKSLPSLGVGQSSKKLAFGNNITVKKLSEVKTKTLDRKATVVLKKPRNGSLIPLSTRDQLPFRTEREQHIYNIANIIKYSNVTPFFTKSYNGIECAYCKKPHKDLQSLKLHTSTHEENKEEMIAYRNSVQNLTVKLDITDLKCNLCSKNYDILSTLKRHLIKDHNVKFYAVTKDYTLEFKLSDNGKFDCALCNSPFETFKMLLQHMNRHYRNFTCNECGSAYINMHKLLTHKKSHVAGEFKCSQCDHVSTTDSARNCHEKCAHSPAQSRKCPICSKNFSNYYRRNIHMVKEHKTEATNYKCNVCDKSFFIKSRLTKHIKSYHLMEKDHGCDECGMQFDTKKHLRDHMVKHNGEKIHKCTVCSKAYARMKTLKEHMRIHLNDRRYKCGVCELAFVQKCSLKGHMLSNHGLSLSKYESEAQFEQEKSASAISE